MSQRSTIGSAANARLEASAIEQAMLANVDKETADVNQAAAR